MRHFKLFTTYFLVGAIIYTLITLITKEYLPILPNLLNAGAWIFLLVFAIIGLLIGIAINELFIGFVNSKKITHGSYITSLVIFTAFLSVSRYNSWKYQKFYSNIEANKSSMKYLVLGDQEYVQIAFKKLESSFKSPNDFRLYSFMVKKKDTIFQSRVDTLFNVYFRYFKDRSEHKDYISKVSVFQSTAKLIFFNANADIKFEDLDSTERGYYDKETDEHIKKTLQRLSESEKAKLSDTLEKMLNE